MFDILLLGWRKASKCKNLIRHVQCRLKFLKSKKYAIIRQFRDDIAQLINNGQHQIAFSRVEQLSNDQNLMVAYELLDNFCGFIIINLPYMRRNKDCPNDIKEAMSSLIYAAARCGDLPELQIIRKLFGERYGHTLAETASNLLPGNMVNKQLAEKLNIMSVSEEAKLVLMDEIVRDYNRPVGLLGGDNTLGIQNYKLCGNSPLQQEDRSDGTMKIPMLSLNLPKNPFSTSCVSRAARFVLEPIKFKTGQRNIIEIAKVSSEQRAKHLESPMDIATPATSSENSCQLLENMVVYLDDMEEYQANEVSDCIGKDQRVFLFNELGDLPDFACEEDCVNRPNSRNERAIMNLSNIGKTKLSRRSMSREQKMTYQIHHRSPTTNMMDMEWELYYGEPHTQTFSSSPKFCGTQLHHQRKHRRMPSQAGRSSSFACHENLGVCPSCEWKYRSQTSCSRCRFSRQMEFNCCLENPCCICPSDNTDNIVQEKMFVGCHCLSNNCKTFHFKSCAGETEEEFSDCPAISASSLASSSRKSTPYAKAMAKGPYSRAVTMPPERQKGAQVTNMARSSSFVTPTSSTFRHVHPKLPDYDELAAKFLALKKDHLQCTGR